MSSLFFYGTLRDADLLRLILGPCADNIIIRDAQLAQHCVYWAKDQVFPMICAEPGAIAVGVLLTDLTDEHVARLDYYEGGFGYTLKPIQVSVTDEIFDALTYFPDSGLWERGEVWSLPAWQAAWGDLNRKAAQEAMGYFGQISAAELAKRMPMIRSRAAARIAAADEVPANIRSDTSSNEVIDISIEPTHAGFFVTRTYELRHPTFAGGLSDTVHREVFVATDAAIVLPYDPKRDRVLLVEQFRMGPYGRGDPKPWMLEPVAGRVDPGETPEDAAHRECFEEAGLRLGHLEKIAGYYCSPGCSTEYFHCYVGLCDLPQETTGQGGLDSEHEDIRTHVLGFNEAMELLTSGEADNGPLILSLVWLARERDRLRALA